MKKASKIKPRLLLLFPMLLGGCFTTTSRFDNETDEDAIKRIKWWGVDIPEDTKLLSRYYSPWNGWDGGYDNIYHTFEIDSEFTFNEGDTTTNFKIFENAWTTIKELKLFKTKDSDWPEFDKDMKCSLVMQLEKETYSDESNEKSYSFSQAYLDEDVYYSRLEKLSEYDESRYIGKAYIIYQPHSKKIYSYFVQDTSLSYKLKN